MTASQTAAAELAAAIELLDNASDEDQRFTAEVLVIEKARALDHALAEAE